MWPPILDMPVLSALRSSREFRARIGWTIFTCLLAEVFFKTPVPGLRPDVALALSQSDSPIRHASIAPGAFTAYFYAWCLVEWIGARSSPREKSNARWLFVTGVALIQAIVVDVDFLQSNLFSFETRGFGLAYLVVVHTAGVLFIVWLGHLNEHRGIGGGVWGLMAFCTCAEVPSYIRSFVWPPPAIPTPLSWQTVVCLLAAMTALVVLMELAFVEMPAKKGAVGARIPLDTVLLLPVGLASLLAYVLGIAWVVIQNQELPQLSQLSVHIFALGDAHIPVTALATGYFAFVLNRRRRREIAGAELSPLPDLVCALYLVTLYALLETLFYLSLVRVEITGDALLLWSVLYLTLRNQVRAYQTAKAAA